MSEEIKKDFIHLFAFLSEHRSVIEREQQRTHQLLAKMPPEIKNPHLEINNLYSGMIYMLDRLNKKVE
ncbi:hypothetical protein J1N10_13015 [Carboxylicivirga sp. A043]|uniref:hypothetical protein n=1 Tax=Carboxylicivirga litoralis TaxID=2816963 RepID=UPI0021CB4C2B|nr:hypothetical protein [Carboxylicivirga sp. A043]MCU4156902.1 hypothetical protein [Carboxylicivirga sp. A043]